MYVQHRGVQILSAVTRSARVHAPTATSKDNTLKMEVRDQSSDGQVEESEIYLMNCRLEIESRNGSFDVVY